MKRLRAVLPALALVPIVFSPAVAGQPEPRAILKGHSDEVYALAFSPDGKTLASGGQDASLRLWDVATEKERLALTKPDGNPGKRLTVYALAFSPDGKTLASSGNDKVVRLWDTATGTLRGKLEGHKWSVRGIGYTADGATLISVDWEAARFWDTATGKARKTINFDTAAEDVVAFDPDVKLLATGHDDGLVQIWDVVTGERTSRFGGMGRHYSRSVRINTLAFSPDGKTLADAVRWNHDGSDVPLRLWDRATGKEVMALERQEKIIGAVAFGPDGKTLFTGTWVDGMLRVWPGGPG